MLCCLLILMVNQVDPVILESMEWEAGRERKTLYKRRLNMNCIFTAIQHYKEQLRSQCLCILTIYPASLNKCRAVKKCNDTQRPKTTQQTVRLVSSDKYYAIDTTEKIV